MLNRQVSFSLLILAFSALFLFSNTSANAQDEISEDPEVISQGESLFKTNCATCHKIHERYIGPALQDVYNRAPSIDWIKSFVQNSQRVIASGDDYANDLYEEYNQTVMTSFTSFEDEDIMAILAYIKQETDAGPAEVAPVEQAEGGGTAPPQDSVPGEYLNIVLIGLIVVLVLIFAVLLIIVNIMRRYLKQQEDVEEEDQELVNQSFSISEIVRSKPFMFISIFILTALILKGVINGLYGIGVQKGYQPAQPIAFSHALHAGQYQIDCQYCHTGVRKSKSANIPSANICMNCHSAILTESPQIQKIYAAVENNQPIEWIRVHNLPDLVYFNHSQHVNVGEIECQTCHGEIQEMEVVEQHSLLTMGWCIECHRETEVNAKDNAYYEKLLEYHKNKDQMTVEDIGGLECAKCHY